MNIWPNFFIVGAAKAGTTSLYAYLNHTPGVYMSPIKEPGYFRTTDFGSKFKSSRISDKSKYLKLFSEVKSEKAIGEATPGYLADPDSANLIYQAVPHAKIIISLRDPVERAYSQYLWRITKTGITQSFHEIVTERVDNVNDTSAYNFCLDPGLYTKNVKRYQDLFGSEQVKIIIFEEFVKNPKKIVKEVLEFLEVNADAPTVLEKTYNAYSKPRGKLGQSILGNRTIRKIAPKLFPQSLLWKVREDVLLKKGIKPKMDQVDRSLLENFYIQNVKSLQILLKRKVPWDWANKFD